MDQFSQEPSAKRQITSLLALLGSSGLAAVLLAWMMIAYYGPSGHYSAENVLLRPDTLETFSYIEKKYNKATAQKFIFAGLFLEGDNLANAKPLSLKKYEVLFQNLAADVSADEQTSGDAISLGSDHSAYTISIMVRPADKASGSSERIFQQMHLYPAQDFYSITTYHGDIPQQIHFRHEGLASLIVKWLDQ